MKIVRILILSFLLISILGFSQKKLPIVYANSTKVKIYEEDNPVSNWSINSKLKIDQYTTNKLVKTKTVKFKTDIDSISFKIKSGMKRDFIVILNGKDSCLTRIQSPEVKNFSKLKPEIHDSIPFFVNKFNTNYMNVVFNKVDSLKMNFDTGANDVDFTNEALQKKIKSNPKLYDTDYDFKIGKRDYKAKVYDIELAGNETDGLLGRDLFDGMVVELNYDKNKMIIHSKMPTSISNDKQYSKFNIKYIKGKPFIETEISQNGIQNKSYFLFDLGYQKTVMLDNDLLNENHFPTDKMAVIKKVIMHGTSGNEVPVITSNLETLKLGKFELKNIPTQILTQNKPIPGLKMHILGNEILKKFNTVLDFQNNVIYLKPNHLYDLAFSDQIKEKS
ncbi:hypothetical protein [Halpernia frigidisoli]|uniref:Aspartyl protease n=1 Tax=Halpernia frigidisoli TaxID=1125876 RepID=A0A1I3GTH6_9FLAO|nr:hypothetical protein [Halpernia frigidisoli]SFI26747.1 Aspartyl protease [Halpernia frigidisoli]